MNQEINHESNQTPNWFEQLKAEFDYELPKRGQFLEGEIIRIDQDAIVVDVGVKRDAIIPARDLGDLEDEFVEQLSVGKRIMVYVMRDPVGDQDLLVSLSKGVEYENWEKAEEYLKEGTVLELPVVGQNRGGLLLQFESLRGFLPFSQVPELRRIHDHQRAETIKREMIGTQVPAKVIEVNRKRRRLIFSAREAEEERRKKRLEELQVGEIIRGPVVNIVKFGIFVDLEGVDGLVHISRLDWTHVEHPSDMFKLGDEVSVKVIDVDVERERVSLDRKSLQPSPWETFAQSHQAGETLEGRVTNVLDFGAFVELQEGVEGLVHVTEIGYSTSGKPQDLVHPGDKVLVRILEIDLQRERASLSMRQVPLESQIAWSLEHTTPQEDQAAEPLMEANPESVLHDDGAAAELSATGETASSQAEAAQEAGPSPILDNQQAETAQESEISAQAQPEPADNSEGQES